MDTKRFAVNGLNVVVECCGDPSGFPLLCFHGWLDNAASFFPLSKFLDQNYYMNCVDMVGHGFSSHLPLSSHYSLLDYLFFSLELINMFEYKEFGIIGHSFGAFLALLIASILHKKVKFIITLDALGPIVSEGDKAYEKMIQHIHNYSSVTPVFFKTEEEAIAERSKQWRISVDTARILVKRDLLCENGQYKWRHDYRLQAHNPLRLTSEQANSFLERVIAPILYIHATAGYPYKEDYVERNLKTLKNVVQSAINGGHHIHMEKPLEVANIINSFISDQSN